MNIIPYEQAFRPQFESMLCAYFREIGGDIPEHIIRGKLLDLFQNQQSRQIIHIALAVSHGTPVGFSIYQIDTPESDWCKRPGWGFIREFYIAPEYRLCGYGRQLACYSEAHLRSLGAAQLYLTADDAVEFWQHCGYQNSREICSNNLEILVK